MRRNLIVMFSAVVVCFALCSNANAAGQVYLFRGLANIFSYGMDALAVKLQRRGIATSLHSYLDYDQVAVEAIKFYRSGKGPIIIAGHSFGADSAMDMAKILNEARVPVALIVLFGPAVAHEAPPNVRHVVNYFQSNSAWRAQISRGAGFRGRLANVDLENAGDITHFNIDKIDRLHRETIARIQAIAGSRRRNAAPGAISGTLPANSDRHSAN